MSDDLRPSLPPVEPEWFAVDGIGEIGLFVADMFGAVPEAASPILPRQLDDLLPLLAIVDAAQLSYAAADLFARDIPLASRPIDGPPRWDQSLAGVLIELRDPAALPGPRPGLAVRRLPSREAAYVYGTVETPALRELWHSGAVVRAIEGHELSPTRLGMYLYQHEAGRPPTRALPYRRLDRPEQPVRVETLPTIVRARLARVRLAGVEFRASEAVQPCAHVPCHVPTGVWRDLDGSDHAVA